MRVLASVANVIKTFTSTSRGKMKLLLDTLKVGFYMSHVHTSLCERVSEFNTVVSDKRMSKESSLLW